MIECTQSKIILEQGFNYSHSVTLCTSLGTPFTCDVFKHPVIGWSIAVHYRPLSTKIYSSRDASDMEYRVPGGDLLKYLKRLNRKLSKEIEASARQ